MQKLHKRQILLIVDDKEINRVVLKEQFKDYYTVMEAENGAQALEVIQQLQGYIAALLLDVMMPIMDGFDVLEQLHTQGMESKFPIFLITADDSQRNMSRAYELGVMDVINKPITPHFVKRRVNSVVELFLARERLNEIVQKQEAALYEKNKEIYELNTSIIQTLAAAIEYRDCKSGQHVQRIYDITLLLLEQLKLQKPEKYFFTNKQMKRIAIASVMHDVGKLAIPDYILKKPGKLTEKEFEFMKLHTIQGCELLELIPRTKDNLIFQYAYDICRHHHERWDGNGYPDGLKQNEITIWAQVVSLADVYDALISERVYKKALPHEQALDMILNGECGAFNPDLLECLKGISKECWEKRVVKNGFHFEKQHFEANTCYDNMNLFLDQIPGGFFRCYADEKGTIDFVSDTLLNLYGYDEQEFRSVTQNCFSGMIYSDDVAFVEKEIQQKIEQKKDEAVCFRIKRNDGSLRWIEGRFRLVGDMNQTQWLYALFLDVTEKNNYLELLQEHDNRQSIFSSLHQNILFDINCESGRVDIFGDFEKQFGRKPLKSDFHALNRCGKQCRLRNKELQFVMHPTTHMTKGDLNEDICMETVSGQTNWCRYQTAVIKRQQDQIPLHHIGKLVHMDELFFGEEEQNDELTGVLSRSAVIRLIRENTERPQEYCPFVMFLVDLDNFKLFNQTYGYPVGDTVLKHVAKYLVQMCDAKDTISRIGSDEFMAFLPRTDSFETVQKKLQNFCNEVFHFYGSNQQMQNELAVSIGAVYYEGKEITFEQLYQRAKQNLAKAKRKGKNTIYFDKI